MKNYSKGECTLDALSVIDSCVQGAQLNCFKFLMNEML
jgi:hypothetical protein